MTIGFALLLRKTKQSTQTACQQILGFLFIPLFVLGAATAQGATNTQPEKLDICTYSAKDVAALQQQLRQRFSNKKQVDLAVAFSNTPSTPQIARKNDATLHKITEMPLGKRLFVSYTCPISDANTNVWVLRALEDTTNKLTQLELYLFYDDKDFPKRNEPLSSQRIRNENTLIKVVRQMGKSRPMTRQAFRHAMLAGGFLLHKSCQFKQANADFYFAPPVVPNSIPAYLGRYFTPIIPNSVTLYFSQKNYMFLRAKSPRRSDSQRCWADENRYNQQRAHWLKKNYPNSVIYKQLEAEEKINEKINEKNNPSFFARARVALKRGIHKPKKLDICTYGSKDVETLQHTLYNRLLYKKQVDLTSLFSNTPNVPQESEDNDAAGHRMTGVPLGKTLFISYKCPISDGNTNIWLLQALENTEKRLIQLEVHLFYEDKNFPKRNEPLLAQRILFSTPTLIKIVRQINKSRPMTRQAFRQIMLAGGFFFNRSCSLKQANADIYYFPPVAPNSILAFRGFYFMWDEIKPNIALYFSKKDHQFLRAQDPSGSNSEECYASDSVYQQQTLQWLKDNYPNSWFVKRIKSKESIKKIRKVTYLEDK